MHTTRNLLKLVLFSILSLGLLAPQFSLVAVADAGARSNQDEGREHRRGQGMRGQQWMRDLDLTDEQRSKIKEIRQAGRESTKSSRERMKAAREAFQSEMESGGSSSSLQSKHEAMINARAEFARARFNQMLQVREVLTPEQRKKFKGMGRFGGQGKRGHRSGQRGGFDSDEG